MHKNWQRNRDNQNIYYVYNVDSSFEWPRWLKINNVCWQNIPDVYYALIKKLFFCCYYSLDSLNGWLHIRLGNRGVLKEVNKTYIYENIEYFVTYS